jgi:hypothetical protein
MTIPKRYEDLTVDQFQKLEALKKLDLEPIDRAAHRLSILSGQSVDDIENMSPQYVYDKLSDALFLANEVHVMPINETFKLKGKEFRFIKEVSGYTIAQHKDFKEFLKANNNDYISCLPELLCICHQEKTDTGFKYDPTKHHENIELFKSAKLSECFGAVFFYSNCLKSYAPIIKTCLEENQRIVNEHVQTMMADPEFQTFLKDGGMNIG